MRQQALLLDDDPWLPVRDGDATCRDIFDRHYSRRPCRIGTAGPFVGPGEKMVLRDAAGDALFIWRRFIDDCPLAPAGGVNCAVFRNESRVRSSTLIAAAELWAWRRWPAATLYTYVNAGAVRSSNPGFCFLAAGWERMPDRTIGGLRMLRRSP